VALRVGQRNALPLLSEIDEHFDRLARHREPSRALVESQINQIQASISEIGCCPAEPNQFAIPLQQFRMRLPPHFAPVELRTGKCVWRLRVGNLIRIPAECGKFPFSPLSHSTSEFWVGMSVKVQ